MNNTEEYVTYSHGKKITILAFQNQLDNNVIIRIDDDKAGIEIDLPQHEAKELTEFLQDCYG